MGVEQGEDGLHPAQVTCQRKRCDNVLRGKQEKWCGPRCRKAAENLRRYHRLKAGQGSHEQR